MKNLKIHHTAIIDSGAQIGDGSSVWHWSHICSNAKIGKNVTIEPYVVFGPKVKIGNNVRIGGGSGVINDIPDNTKVMGYPAKNLREFIKDNR